MEKTCTTCRASQPLHNFAPHKTGVMGRYSYCRNCVRERNKKYYAANAEREKRRAGAYRDANADRKRETQAVWRQANKDRLRDYRIANAGDERERARDRYSKNPAAWLATGARRRAARKQAVPIWANETEIRAKYMLAVELTRSTGIPHEVDHVVPLQSPVVCGLHWHENLQVVPRSVNRSKSNRMEVQ